MAILLNKETKVICQGFTGTQGTFHSQRALEAGTVLVGGVTPDKGGQTHLGLPVFNTIAEAVDKTGCNASGVFVPPPFAADAILEGVEAGLDLIVCITDGVPVRDMQRVKRDMRGRKTRLIGPNCPGVLSPRFGKIGIIPSYICKEGRIGVISRSGTLSYETAVQLSASNMGQSTIVGIGGDPVNGTNYADVLELFMDDDDTDGIVIIGEIGGTAEIDVAQMIKRLGKKAKPVAAFVAGASAPQGRKLGHAGAIVSSGEETAEAKKEALKSAGAIIAETIIDIGKAMKQALDKKT
ncbi:MAG: succinate--CoA ligase subunit alpha [Alphaproteobacteria bacterium GM7ARS4]|nr:succinate--CoA ligase subunit alpha [Alphaproteobacteria bacterium GM7ARS4]